MLVSHEGMGTAGFRSDPTAAQRFHRDSLLSLWAQANMDPAESEQQMKSRLGASFHVHSEVVCQMTTGWSNSVGSLIKYFQAEGMSADMGSTIWQIWEAKVHIGSLPRSGVCFWSRAVWSGCLLSPSGQRWHLYKQQTTISHFSQHIGPQNNT